MGIVLLVLLIWFVGWMVERHKKDKKRREQVVLNAYGYSASNIHGHGAFADEKAIKADGLNKGYIVAGRLKKSKKIVYFNPTTGSPHFGVWGGTGDGKSSLLQSTILNWPYHLIVFDPTYEHVCTTARYRSQIGPCNKLAPLRGFERESRYAKHVRMNPMGRHYLDPKRRDFDPRAFGISSSIVSKVVGHNSFFFDSPRGILAGMIMAQILHAKTSEQNLPFIAREIVNGDPYAYCKHILSITKNRAIRAILARMTIGNEAFLKSIPEFMETLKTEMTPLLNEAVAESLSAADITFTQFTQLGRPRTLYINEPLEQIGTFGPINKLLLGSLLGELFQGNGGPEPCLVIMDELYQYGKDLEALPAAFAAGRKYNVILAPCLTTWSELVSMYGKGHETVANNLGMLQFLSVGDVAGSEYVSKLLGDVEVHATGKSLSAPSDWNIPAFYDGPLEDVLTDVPSDEMIAKHIKVNYTYSQVKRPLMAPFEIRQELGRDEQLVIIRSLGRPLRLRKAPYYEMPWRNRADRNPFFRK